jgi:hypothetical protein
MEEVASLLTCFHFVSDRKKIYASSALKQLKNSSADGPYTYFVQEIAERPFILRQSADYGLLDYCIVDLKFIHRL